MMRILVLGAALLLSVEPLCAAEIGRVQFDGRDVILDDDGTWTYAAAAASPGIRTLTQAGTNDAPLSCNGFEPSVSARIKFAACFDPAVWTAADPIGEQEFLAYSTDGKTAVAVITETTVIPMDAYQDAIVEVAKQSSGATGDVAVTAEGTGDYAKHTWRTFRYVLPVQGTDFSYLNYHVSGPAVGSVQVVFWTVPGDEAFSDAAAAELLSQMAFGD